LTPFDEADAQAVTQSLEIAGERGGDLTGAVYARLFAEHPEMEALFVRDTDGLVRGEMLARVFDAILDFMSRRAYSAQLIQCEVVTHEGYGVPPAVFGVFFDTVAETVRAVVGEAWSAATDRAWRRLLADLRRYVAHPDQATPV
jgi:hemoglobin-like flavoprotein